jgi:hypothetical protein
MQDWIFSIFVWQLASLLFFTDKQQTNPKVSFFFSTSLKVGSYHNRVDEVMDNLRLMSNNQPCLLL